MQVVKTVNGGHYTVTDQEAAMIRKQRERDIVPATRALTAEEMILLDLQEGR